MRCLQDVLGLGAEIMSDQINNSLSDIPVDRRYDVIVVGAGHAGCEAALAAARMGRRTLLLTMNLDSVALMPCNPSIGGPAKGHLVREIDALGGEMGRATDRTFIQMRLLNTSKGPAVQALRAQCDKQAYRLTMKYALERQPNLELKQATVNKLLVERDADGRQRISGVLSGSGAFSAGAVILTTGTFINGRLVVGDWISPGGRAGEGPSLGISDELRALGMTVKRFKTGTPPRIDARTVDFSQTSLQIGSQTPLYFSYDVTAREDVQIPPGAPHPIYPLPEEARTAWRPQLPCYLVHTNERTHDLIRANLDRSPLYTGVIEGIGPRYCPSIEDKVVRFAEQGAPPGLSGAGGLAHERGIRAGDEHEPARRCATGDAAQHPGAGARRDDARRLRRRVRLRAFRPAYTGAGGEGRAWALPRRADQRHIGL